MDNLLEWRDRDGSSDYIPLVDHRNSVVGAWDIMSGSLTGVADYTAQGRLTLRDELEQPTCVEEGNAGTLCDAPGGMPFAFNSRWRSPRTGLVNMRARWYSPKLGQFTSHDPLGYVDTQNLYAFAGFDPVNAWDPTGREWTDFFENPEDGSVSPYAGGVKSPKPGEVKVFVVSRDFEFGNVYVNHSEIHVLNSRGEWWSREVYPSSAGDELVVNDALAKPDSSSFDRKWRAGDIEYIAEGKVAEKDFKRAKKQSSDLEKRQKDPGQSDKAEYELIPDGTPDEANCHSYIAECLGAMNETWPTALDDADNPLEHVGGNTETNVLTYEPDDKKSVPKARGGCGGSQVD